MQWYGILAFFFMLSVLAGLVYVGGNTDQLGFDFGKPTRTSQDTTYESSSSYDVSTGSTISYRDYLTKDGFDMEEFEKDLKQEISKANTPQEAEAIIEDFTKDFFSDPQVAKECQEIVDKSKAIQEDFKKWTSGGNDPYDFPRTDEMIESTKQVVFCSAGVQYGFFELDN